MKSFMNFFFDVIFIMFSMEGWKYLAFMKIFAKWRFIINFNFGEYDCPFHIKKSEHTWKQCHNFPIIKKENETSQPKGLLFSRFFLEFINF